LRIEDQFHPKQDLFSDSWIRIELEKVSEKVLFFVVFSA